METAHGLVNSRNKHQQSIWLARKTQKTKQYFTNLKWRFFAGCSWFPMVSPPSQSIPKTNGEAPQVHPWTAPAMNSLPPAGLDGTVGISLENCASMGSIWIYMDLLYITISSLHPETTWWDFELTQLWPPEASLAKGCCTLRGILKASLMFFTMDGWMDR